MSATAAAPATDYRVQDDLNRESLPQSQRDPTGKVAWTNAICAAVLGVGVLFHAEARRFEFRAEVVDSLPVEIPEFVPEVTPPQTQDKQEEEPSDQVNDAPVVPTVVVADSPSVNFSVAVTGPTVTAKEFTYVPPPPRNPPKHVASAPSGPQVFRGGASTDGGTYPDVPYPRDALMRRETGEVQLYVAVTEDGSPEKVEVRISSGSPVLDRSSRQHVQKYWRWPAGPRREYLVPIEFVIR